MQDRYEILEEIGSDGMSDIHKARCYKLNRPVVTKVLKEESNSGEGFVNKFKMEAQAVAGPSHSDVADVYDATDEGSPHYIVTELIEGITLESYTVERGRLDMREVVGISIQVARGVVATHERNITYRGIKPQNMIISRDDKAKVADLSITRAVATQTLSSAVMGPICYTSPEQARGGYNGVRSDIHSLGITVYETPTGRLSFEGDNTVTVVLAHLGEPTIRLSHHNPVVPVSLESIILKCVEKKSEYRHANINELIADLKHALVNPDENSVIMSSEEPDYPEIITIFPKGLDAIDEGQKIYKPSTPPGRGHQEATDGDGVDLKVEKLTTAVGIVVAILIVAVLISVFSKLGGLFSLGFGGKTSTTTTEPVVVTESASLVDAEACMPGVLNLPEDIAEIKLKDNTLMMKIGGYEGSETVERGYVLRQEMPEGVVVSKYPTANVALSNGTNTVTLVESSLTGLNTEAAESPLEPKQIVVAIGGESNETMEEGKVLRCEPEKAKPGETMTLTVSSRPAAPLAKAPNIAGVTDEMAQEVMVNYGFIKGEVTEGFSGTTPADTVISRVTVAGIQLMKRSPIDYTLSKESDYPSKRYVASISETYNLANSIGPGADSSNIQVSIRLKRMVNNEPVYKELTQPRAIIGQDLLPVNLPNIEGVPGVETGKVETIGVISGTVIESYPIKSLAVEIEQETSMTGKIIEGTAGLYYVHTGQQIYECKVRGVFRNRKLKSLVGSNVGITVLDEETPKDNTDEILSRSNTLVCSAVVNIDQVLVVSTITHPSPNLDLLDKFLVMVERLEIPVTTVFNRIDLTDEVETNTYHSTYEPAECWVLFASVSDGDGMEGTRALIRGETTVLAEPSGMGKSSLTNILQFLVATETGATSEKTQREKYIIRHSRLFLIEEGTYMVDTPGLSSMYIEDMQVEELGHYFLEPERYEEMCRLLGCVHIGEKVCGIKDAVERGEVNRNRHENYWLFYQKLGEE